MEATALEYYVSVSFWKAEIMANTFLHTLVGLIQHSKDINQRLIIICLINKVNVQFRTINFSLKTMNSTGGMSGLSVVHHNIILQTLMRKTTQNGRSTDSVSVGLS